MSKYAKRLDANHQDVIKTLRSIEGVIVEDTSDIGGGFPDLLKEKKIKTAIENLKKATEANSKKNVFGTWVCKSCGVEKPATAHQIRKKYCSNKCVSDVYKTQLSGANNPNYSNAGSRKCEHCGETFKHYKKSRKFCGIACRDKANFPLRSHAKKDANHDEIVSLLESGGAKVIDTHMASNGFPDLVVLFNHVLSLVEVKNSQTLYGRNGFTSRQDDFAKKFAGWPVYIFRTSKDVSNFLSGEVDKIDFPYRCAA